MPKTYNRRADPPQINSLKLTPDIHIPNKWERDCMRNSANHYELYDIRNTVISYLFQIKWMFTAALNRMLSQAQSSHFWFRYDVDSNT